MKVQRNILTIFSLIALLLITAMANADDTFPVLNTTELKQLLDQKGSEITVVDARNAEEYQEVHIKGAINIPEKIFAENVGLLPTDKTRQIVLYCNGIKCGKSKKAAKKASDMGYTNIQVYAEGMPVWEEKGLPIYAGPDYEKKIETTKIVPKDLQALMQSKAAEVTVVDVRDLSEFQEGHIPGAINIPVAEFASQSGQLDKKNTIIVSCNSGGRSYNAYRKLMKLGYEKIGQAIFQDWKDQGLPVETAAQ
ncbi:MAG: rhodanese-like domain-containing protein [Proteobacteria bacterium]|nr:rhodanese-like domain-containing protein [Desulfobulbaceae bacterium]MBU4151536.1 rhodanese-like domain-containing protein [Pseudomonadota bacterium]MDP2104604.1 rhodanese-like domain-containing protein [Desulfobulbaceae bacterium]